MRKAIILFLTVACIFAFSQPSIRDARKKSWQCLVYRIAADTAERYINKSFNFPDHYLDQTAFAVWQADSLKYEELPADNYLIFSVVENELLAEYYCQRNLHVFPLNHHQRVQLEVKDDAGNIISNARLWAKKKK